MGAKKNIEDFQSSASLSNGVCTDCHAGENPLIGVDHKRGRRVNRMIAHISKADDSINEPRQFFFCFR